MSLKKPDDTYVDRYLRDLLLRDERTYVISPTQCRRYGVTYTYEPVTREETLTILSRLKKITDEWGL